MCFYRAWLRVTHLTVLFVTSHHGISTDITPNVLAQSQTSRGNNITSACCLECGAPEEAAEPLSTCVPNVKAFHKQADACDIQPTAQPGRQADQHATLIPPNIKNLRSQSWHSKCIPVESVNDIQRGEIPFERLRFILCDRFQKGVVMKRGWMRAVTKCDLIDNRSKLCYLHCIASHLVCCTAAAPAGLQCLLNAQVSVTNKINYNNRVIKTLCRA